MKVLLIGFCVGKTSWMPLRRYPPRSSVTVVRIVGTLNAFAPLRGPRRCDDQRRLVAVQVGELKRLVIDEQ